MNGTGDGDGDGDWQGGRRARARGGRWGDGGKIDGATGRVRSLAATPIAPRPGARRRRRNAGRDAAAAVKKWRSALERRPC